VARTYSAPTAAMASSGLPQLGRQRRIALALRVAIDDAVADDDERAGDHRRAH
jgi:hypothetical protein